jgi:prepilin-type N-terminal cleavage/methylation domain-containing protein
MKPNGFSAIEAVVVIALLGIVLSISVPTLSALRDHGRTAAGARVLATELNHLRWVSVARRRGTGLFFERGPVGWGWRIVEDGNGNGIRTGEIRRGVDATLSGPHRLEERVEKVRLGFPPGGPFPAIPPRRGNISNLDDPVQFGRSDVVAFSPLGRSSSGTLYVTDGRRALYGIVLFGPASRVRVWRFDPDHRRWTL